MASHKSVGCQPFSLQTLYNIRDLGGHPTVDGNKTRCGCFVRSDAPVRLRQAELEALLAYPIRHVIDLRSQNEISKQPSNLQDQPLINYYNIPLLGADLEKDMIRLQKTNAHKDIELVDLYLHIIDQSQEAIGAVLHQMVRSASGAILFNCTHGKDRTGVIAALLLSLAGVAPDRIIEDYRISEVQLTPWFNTFIRHVPAADRHFFTTPKRYMIETLQHLAARYDSVPAYLLRCGVTAADQAILKERLLGPS